MLVLKALLDLRFNAFDNFVDASPGVLILSPPTNHEERLQNVDDIVYPTSLYAELLRALVQKQSAFAFDSVVLQKASAELA